MSTCQECGNAVSPAASFCGVCGAQQGEAQKPPATASTKGNSALATQLSKDAEPGSDQTPIPPAPKAPKSPRPVTHSAADDPPPPGRPAAARPFAEPGQDQELPSTNAADMQDAPPIDWGAIKEAAPWKSDSPPWFLDFSFKRMVTPRAASVAFGIATFLTIAGVLWAWKAIISDLQLILSGGEQFVACVGVVLWGAVMLLIFRMLLEALTATIRTAQNTNAIRLVVESRADDQDRLL